MQETFSVHILEAHQGYHTSHASEDLTSNDINELEAPVFGQSSERAFLRSLDSDPAGLSRRLPSGRIATTRCYPGTPDSAGRPTLSFVTVIAGLKLSAGLGGSLATLLNKQGIWHQARNNRPESLLVTLEDNRKQLTANRLALLTVVDAIASAGARDLFFVPHSTESAALFPLAPRLLPQAQRHLGVGLRIMSPSAPVVICTAETQLTSTYRAIHRMQRRALASQYAKALEAFWKEGTGPPYDFIDGIGDVRNAQLKDTHFSAERSDSGKDRTGATRVKKKRLQIPRRWPLLVGAAALAVLALTAVFWLARGKDKPVEGRVSAYDERRTWSEDDIQEFIESTNTSGAVLSPPRINEVAVVQQWIVDVSAHVRELEKCIAGLSSESITFISETSILPLCQVQELRKYLRLDNELRLAAPPSDYARIRRDFLGILVPVRQKTVEIIRRDQDAIDQIAVDAESWRTTPSGHDFESLNTGERSIRTLMQMRSGDASIDMEYYSGLIDAIEAARGTLHEAGVRYVEANELREYAQIMDSTCYVLPEYNRMRCTVGGSSQESRILLYAPERHLENAVKDVSMAQAEMICASLGLAYRVVHRINAEVNKRMRNQSYYLDECMFRIRLSYKYGEGASR